jgi:hypothetical protein
VLGVKPCVGFEFQVFLASAAQSVSRLKTVFVRHVLKYSFALSPSILHFIAPDPFGEALVPVGGRCCALGRAVEVVVHQ